MDYEMNKFMANFRKAISHQYMTFCDLEKPNPRYKIDPTDIDICKDLSGRILSHVNQPESQEQIKKILAERKTAFFFSLDHKDSLDKEDGENLCNFYSFYSHGFRVKVTYFSTKYVVILSWPADGMYGCRPDSRRMASLLH